MDTPIVNTINPDDHPQIVICNDLIRLLFADARSRCSDSAPGDGDAD